MQLIAPLFGTDRDSLWGLLLIVIILGGIHGGIDPAHLGIIMVVNLEIGMVTPPIGLNLFVTAGITKMSIMQVAKAALPWTLVLRCSCRTCCFKPCLVGSAHAIKGMGDADGSGAGLML